MEAENQQLDILRNYANYWHKQLFENTISSTIFFSFAGGMFKTIFLENKEFDFQQQLRDIDIWPHNQESQQYLISYLQQSNNFTFEKETEFNYLFKYKKYLEIEIVKRCFPNLKSVLDGFDLIFSQIGVEFQGNQINEVIVSPKIMKHRKQQQIKLVKPLPNEPFLLVTLQRILKYQRALDFIVKQNSVFYIKKYFEKQSKEKQQSLLINYKRVINEDFDFKIFDIYSQ